MGAGSQKISWVPALPEPVDGPIYRVIVDVMASDIAAGKLKSGQRLPAHRALAQALGIDLTTVTRAYNEAHRRGLIEAAVGRGTFVRDPQGMAHQRKAHTSFSPVDTGMNLPPQPEDAGFRKRLTDGLAALQRRPDFLSLLTYRQNAGSDEDRAAGAAWLHPLLPDVTPDRVLVCPGAQAALLVLLTTYARAVDVVLTDALTFPGFRALAGQLGIRLRGVAMDAEGLVPDALDAACRQGQARVLYCNPTIQNPTTATMSPERRHAIATVVRRHDLTVIEDDTYGLLPTDPIPPLATLLPERTFYIASLAKCIAPGLRIAYLAVPGTSQAARLAAGIRATTMMAPPLLAALATQWIGDGTARAIVQAIRRESTLRLALAAEILPPAFVTAHPQGHHLWLTPPSPWTGATFAAHARQLGLAAVPGDAFEVSGRAFNGVRLALGAADSTRQLRQALELATDALMHVPAMLSNIG